MVMKITHLMCHEEKSNLYGKRKRTFITSSGKLRLLIVPINNARNSVINYIMVNTKR
jgi:hypothetical protein